MIGLPQLEQLLADFPRLSIGLVGDLFLDRYLEIDPQLDEPSVETGLVAYQVTAVRNSPGALGTVINNLVALGVGRIVPVTAIGDDGHGYDLRRGLEGLGVDCRYVLKEPARLTPTYTKPMRRTADGVARELNRLDLRTRAPLSADTHWRLAASLREAWRQVDGLIVVDQLADESQGVVGPAIRELLAGLWRAGPKPLFIDSRAHIGRFGCGILKTNQSECLATAGAAPTDDLEAIGRVAADRAAATGLTVICTLGERGMFVARPERPAAHVPGYPVSGPVDIVGAGDAATSGFMAALLAGADELAAADVANLVASITVQQLGTTGTATPEQLLARRRQTQARRTS
jgi:rfaE bifunctional protein kinase chain/domain